MSQDSPEVDLAKLIVTKDEEVRPSPISSRKASWIATGIGLIGGALGIGLLSRGDEQSSQKIRDEALRHAQVQSQTAQERLDYQKQLIEDRINYFAPSAIYNSGPINLRAMIDIAVKGNRNIIPEERLKRSNELEQTIKIVKQFGLSENDARLIQTFYNEPFTEPARAQGLAYAKQKGIKVDNPEDTSVLIAIYGSWLIASNPATSKDTPMNYLRYVLGSAEVNKMILNFKQAHPGQEVNFVGLVESPELSINGRGEQLKNRFIAAAGEVIARERPLQ